ncbi:MAG: RNA pseudouridine synthase [Spirochaetaceae bacterium]|jgi:23S rRNA pseudouridine1911/1915/1917 synthase|nr:RNA pseudouridine synthase [Spirochaetaceae bacterium]
MKNFPLIIECTDDYLILYKEALVHTVPLRRNENKTLIEHAALHFPEIREVHGKKEIECGAVHRLDYETKGLVLVARNQQAFNSFCEQQQAGLFIKEYNASVKKSEIRRRGFPPLPFDAEDLTNKETPFFIKSAFRPFGPGRKAVRPIPCCNKTENQSHSEIQKKSIYKSEILSLSKKDDAVILCRIRLTKGFRHQIRCHLAWICHPIIGDSLYGDGDSAHPLALEACTLRFLEPSSGKERIYSVHE